MYFSCILYVFFMYYYKYTKALFILGSNVTLQIFAEELKQLWSTGIRIGEVQYRVGLVNGIWDGKGFEQVTKTQGGGSHKGCNACDFPGTTFAHTVCYPFYSKFLPTHDPRRLQRPPRIVPNYSLLFNLETNFFLTTMTT